MSAVRPYVAIMRQALREGMAFRVALFSKLLTNGVWGYIHAVILWAFYTYGQRGGAEISLAQAVSYTWLGQIVMNLLPGMGVDMRVYDQILSGNVGTELCRPLDVYAHWYARTVTNKLAQFLTAVGPMVLAAALVPAPLGLSAPASAVGLLCCVCALAGALYVSSACVGIINSLTMNLAWGRGPGDMLTVVMQILSGAYLPLQLWPDSIQRLLALQPFAGMMDLPLRFYMGTLAPAQLPLVLLQQLVWGTALLMLGRWAIGRRLRGIAIQGG